MTIYATTQDAIFEAVQAFADAQTVFCAYPNVAFTPPRTRDMRNEAWMRLSISEGPIAAENLFAGYRPTYRAAFTLSFFVPNDAGTRRMIDLVDAALAAFPAGDSVGPAVIDRASLVTAPSVEGWAQQNVTFFFRADT